jgi:hypothetical protein
MLVLASAIAQLVKLVAQTLMRTLRRLVSHAKVGHLHHLEGQYASTVPLERQTETAIHRQSAWTVQQGRVQVQTDRQNARTVHLALLQVSDLQIVPLA